MDPFKTAQAKMSFSDTEKKVLEALTKIIFPVADRPVN